MHLRTDTSQSNHSFSRVPTISHSRNAFSIARKHVTTIQFDYLYPLYWKYIYPGDTLSISQNIMARLQTQIAPLYDDLYIDVHAWFTAMRLLQTNWARYQFNAQPTGPTQDNSALVSPKIDTTALTGGFVAKTLYDYLGFPTETGTLAANNYGINNYLARAYNFIWNENYRDENLQNAVVFDVDDGPDDPADYVLLKRGRRHDKFASCLTAQQKGTAVTIPFSSSSANVALSATTGVSALLKKTSDHSLWGGATVNLQVETGTNTLISSSSTKLLYDPNTTLYADLSSAAATLNAFRTSFAVQHLLEADARGGTRDVEAIQHRWGVTVPDFRLQRPEYLGGQTFTFDGHLVPQTSASSGSNYQAGLTQFSDALSSMNVTHSFVEHGVFMILISCRSNVSYQEGLRKELCYSTRYDWYQPEFANLGEVAVKNKEIYFQGNGNANDDLTFGYQEYAYELRYDENIVTSEMRSNYATSLDSRHMATDYASLPTLGSAWIVSDTPISRNIAVSAATADPIQLNTLVAGTIARTLPMFSIPGLKRL